MIEPPFAPEARLLASDTPQQSPNPSWVSITGYALEKVHTGVLAWSLDRGSPESAALLAALWNDATGSDRALDTSSIRNVIVRREEPVGSGSDTVMDLLVGFDAGDHRCRLGFEVKVDAPPRAGQVERQLEGLARRSRPERDQCHIVLLALGAAQVCHEQGSMPPRSSRWDIDHVLRHFEAIRRAASADHIVIPWFDALDAERHRRDRPDVELAAMSPGQASRHRAIAAYKLAAIVNELRAAPCGPWHVNVLAHNVVAHALGSRVTRNVAGADATLYIELTDSALTIKAFASSPIRGGHRLLATELQGVLNRLPQGFLDVRQRKRLGASMTLAQSRISLDDRTTVAERVRVLADAWQRAMNG